MPAQLTLAPAAARDLDNVRLWLTQPGAGATAHASLIDISDAIETIADPHPGPAPAYATLVRVLRVFRPGQSRDIGYDRSPHRIGVICNGGASGASPRSGAMGRVGVPAPKRLRRTPGAMAESGLTVRTGSAIGPATRKFTAISPS